MEASSLKKGNLASHCFVCFRDAGDQAMTGLEGKIPFCHHELEQPGFKSGTSGTSVLDNILPDHIFSHWFGYCLSRPHYQSRKPSLGWNRQKSLQNFCNWASVPSYHHSQPLEFLGNRAYNHYSTTILVSSLRIPSITSLLWYISCMRKPGILKKTHGKQWKIHQLVIWVTSSSYSDLSTSSW